MRIELKGKTIKENNDIAKQDSKNKKLHTVTKRRPPKWMKWFKPYKFYVHQS